MKIKSLIIISIVALWANSFATAASRDTTYLEIKKIEITNTHLLNSINRYIDTLKKYPLTDASGNLKWYLRLVISRDFGYKDTIDTRYTVEYSRLPYNPDDPDNFFPTYYTFVQNIPMVVDVDRYPDFSLSSKMVLAEDSKNRLIDILMPYTPPPEINYAKVDEKTGKTRVFKNYWPALWRDGEYKLKLSIIKSRKHKYYNQIKKQY